MLFIGLPAQFVLPVPLSRMVAPYTATASRGRNFGTAILIPVTNMLERLNEEIKRRTIILRIFPNEESCLRLIRALAVKTHENWLEANRYLNMSNLKEMKKTELLQTEDQLSHERQST